MRKIELRVREFASLYSHVFSCLPRDWRLWESREETDGLIDHCTLESLSSLTMVPMLVVVVIIANKELEMLGNAQSGSSSTWSDCIVCLTTLQSLSTLDLPWPPPTSASTRNRLSSRLREDSQMTKPPPSPLNKLGRTDERTAEAPTRPPVR